MLLETSLNRHHPVLDQCSLQDRREEDCDRREQRDHSFSDTDLQMDPRMARKAELPDDLACFLQHQKQRQARLETTMRSFPSQVELEMEKRELAIKRKRSTHEVSGGEFILNLNEFLHHPTCPKKTSCFKIFL